MSEKASKKYEENENKGSKTVADQQIRNRSMTSQNPKLR
jgi:hypothetical protein